MLDWQYIGNNWSLTINYGRNKHSSNHLISNRFEVLVNLSVKVIIIIIIVSLFSEDNIFSIQY